MKNLIILFVLLISTVTYSQSDIDTIKSQIKDLEKQKSSIESQIEWLNAQIPSSDTNAWKFKGNLAINVGQTILQDWAQGGFSNFNLSAIGHGEANYNKGKHSWINTFDGNIGFVKNYDNAKDIDYPMLKSNDFFQLNSRYSYELSKDKKWFYSFNMNFISQFIETFDATNPNILVSDFMAPATLDLAPGIEYRPVTFFKVFMTPISSRMTFVLNDTLANAIGGSFGNDQGQKVRTEFGAKLDAVFEKELLKNLNLRSRLQLFNNYFRNDRDVSGNSRRFNVDVNWQTDIIYKLNKFIALNFNILALYDDDILIYDKKTNTTKPMIQIRQGFGVGVVYGF